MIWIQAGTDSNTDRNNFSNTAKPGHRNFVGYFEVSPLFRGSKCLKFIKVKRVK